jgi:hypothetical protein
MPCARTPAPAGFILSRPRSNTESSFLGAIQVPGSGPFSLGSGCAGPVSFGGRLCRPRASSGGAVVPPVRRGGPRSTETPIDNPHEPGGLTAA